ncbi:MAG: hypothetical protein LAP85_27005 [Acidobacteriia bacterium]|nr:hypothetical protein [Terriglobia bacterium]
MFDRGVVSEENLATLRRRDAQYLVGTPRSELKSFEQELLSDEWEQERPEVEVKLVPIRGGGETYVLCRTSARQDKEEAIRSSFPSVEKRAVDSPDLPLSLIAHSENSCDVWHI